MPATSYYTALRVLSLLLFFMASACGGPDDDFVNEHLIRVGDRVVTVLDFKRAFELSETAHSFGLRDHPAQLGEARERLLNHMTTEMLMLARADELNLAISEEELDGKIEEIKTDYPDDTFEEALLEAAVPFELWKQRMKTRLLIEKLVAVELENQMTITPKEVTAHYEKYFQMKSDSGAEVEYETIIRDLRRQKAEKAYQTWLEGLKTKYPVELNVAAWKKLTASADSTDGQSKSSSTD